ncbi:hypothetical protein [Roseomonas indoligenes]|uniref:DUF1795 domain-containing protein n=1 Tax=Roseomonas indoligenes TaxID=2820811 RepID=A0A940S744_9PROT|nr:hypothetical protein [Pararoseomonas indoligenes]MBP0494560.1 hypothetical protein [Pararoseomonas indoligenes]
MRRIGPLLLAAALAAPMAAAAQPVRDAASGLVVAAPPGYAARSIPPGRGQAARFEVKTPADTDTGCQVAFTPAPQNGRFTQAQLDATMRGAEWQDLARKALSALYEIREARTFEDKGRSGYTMVGDFKGEGLPPRAREVRTLFVIQETPRGRTSTVCVGERTGFETRRAEFMAVATGATPP